jgi:hypothetical protein
MNSLKLVTQTKWITQKLGTKKEKFPILLPENLKAIENVKLFTKKLKLLLLDKMFYHMHDFFSCKFDRSDQ